MATNSPNDSVKNIYISFPDNPNPEEDPNQGFALYTSKVFLETVSQFVACLEKQEGIKTTSRCPKSSNKVKGVEFSDKIENSDCVVLICCPAVVYLLSEESQNESRIEENQFYIELRTIYGQNISNRFRIIPVFLNTSSDSLHKYLPPELGTMSVSVCITTLPECAEELWPAQQKSIDKLVKIIRKESNSEILASPGTEMDAVDEEWCLHFIDQFAIDFISCVFEERNIYTDNSVLENFLQRKDTPQKSVRELLRVWLRTLRQRRVHSVFEEMKLILGELGRQDLMYQLKSQYEFYKEEVYQEQNSQSDKPPLGETK